MTQGEVLQRLSSAELFPIPVEERIAHDDVRDMRFVGDLAGFIEAAKALGSRCVFVASKFLQESDFFYDVDSRRYDDPVEENNIGPVDLIALQPALGEYKGRLGEPGAFRLWVQTQNTSLEFILQLPWWKSFTDVREQSIQARHQNREQAWAKQAEQEEKKKALLLQRLRALLTDPAFGQLPTQRAMQAYAVELIPELEELGAKTLRAEIQALDAKLQVQGLGRKR